MTRSARPGFVYVIRTDGTRRYKIGCSIRGGKTRLHGMSSGSAFPLVLVGDFMVPDIFMAERGLHKEFRQYRRNGEWFELDDASLTRLVSRLNEIQGAMREVLGDQVPLAVPRREKKMTKAMMKARVVSEEMARWIEAAAQRHRIDEAHQKEAAK